jgi:hypothetical protein
MQGKSHIRVQVQQNRYKYLQKASAVHKNRAGASVPLSLFQAVQEKTILPHFSGMFQEKEDRVEGLATRNSSDTMKFGIT